MRAPGSVGTLRRDGSGRIVPGKPKNGAAPPPAGFYDPAIVGLAQKRAERAAAAHRRQAALSRLIERERARKNSGAAVDGDGLTPSEAALLVELRRRDREVNEHEMRHYISGRPYTRFPEFWYVTGPLDGRHAVDGITEMDARPVAHDVAATIRKLYILRRAALAPQSPSQTDLDVVHAIEILIARLRLEANGGGG